VAEPDIVLEHVTKRFQDVVAVNDVSISVDHGEFVSIIGPSGCGKTTTMRLIAGLEQPDEGAIYIKGRRMDGVPPYDRNIGLVFQNFALFPHLNVVENVEFGLRMRGVDPKTRRAKALNALEIVGLTGLEKRQIHQLSGGQRQRVGLARAIVVEPAFILLDEPLGSLDARLRIDMQSELKSLQRQMGITFIHVSHNQSEALAMADRIVVMNQGRFEQIGTPYDVYGAPRTRFVADFVGKNNIFDGEIVESSNGKARVRTEVGTFLVPLPATGAGPGRRVTFVVRADLLHPLDVEGGDGVENKLTGVLQGLEYTGSVVTLMLALPNGAELKVEQHESLTRHRSPRHGEAITVGWRASDTYVLP